MKYTKEQKIKIVEDATHFMQSQKETAKQIGVSEPWMSIVIKNPEKGSTDTISELERWASDQRRKAIG
jgi:transposase-like protein